MKINQLFRDMDKIWTVPEVLPNSQLVLVFGGIDEIDDPSIIDELKTWYPHAEIVLASTAGEIRKNEVTKNTVVATAIQFETTRIQAVSISVSDYENSRQCGMHIANSVMSPDLRHILIISDGTLVNGDELVRGINEVVSPEVLVTGGLAADNGRFEKTLVGLNHLPTTGQIAAIGFYGDKLRVGHGSQGGWDIFGPVRTVTASAGNELFELDGIKALELYKKYLGDRAQELPGSALLFPLCILGEDGSQLVRTILGINEETGAMIFAGDIPVGAKVQFMMANFDRLVDGATHAAEEAHIRHGWIDPELVLMVSCVGRKIVLDQRVEEEVESVVDFFGSNSVYCGFYSNGEISPLNASIGCSLHNQTMTITTYSEIAS
jgi:hypothetical protein